MYREVLSKSPDSVTGTFMIRRQDFNKSSTGTSLVSVPGGPSKSRNSLTGTFYDTAAGFLLLSTETFLVQALLVI